MVITKPNEHPGFVYEFEGEFFNLAATHAKSVPLDAVPAGARENLEVDKNGRISLL